MNRRAKGEMADQLYANQAKKEGIPIEDSSARYTWQDIVYDVGDIKLLPPTQIVQREGTKMMRIHNKRVSAPAKKAEAPVTITDDDCKRCKRRVRDAANLCSECRHHRHMGQEPARQDGS